MPWPGQVSEEDGLANRAASEVLGQWVLHSVCWRSPKPGWALGIGDLSFVGLASRDVGGEDGLANRSPWQCSGQ